MSTREAFVAELQRFVTVDVYGGCSKNQCDDCDELLKKKYW